MTRQQHTRKHTQHNNGYLWTLRKARYRAGRFCSGRRTKFGDGVRQRAQAEALISRFFRLGYEVLWGGGDASKGHGYWIYRGFPSLRPYTTKPGRILLRKELLCGHFNGGNTNPGFQMHYEAVRIVKELERRAKTKGKK